MRMQDYNSIRTVNSQRYLPRPFRVYLVKPLNCVIGVAANNSKAAIIAVNQLEWI